MKKLFKKSAVMKGTAYVAYGIEEAVGYVTTATGAVLAHTKVIHPAAEKLQEKANLSPELIVAAETLATGAVGTVIYAPQHEAAKLRLRRRLEKAFRQELCERTQQ